MPILYNLSYFRLLMSAISISPDFSFFDIHFKRHSNFNGYFEYIKIHWIILCLLEVWLMSSVSPLLGLQGWLSLPLTILYLGHYIFFLVLLFVFSMPLESLWIQTCNFSEDWSNFQNSLVNLLKKCLSLHFIIKCVFRSVFVNLYPSNLPLAFL